MKSVILIITLVYVSLMTVAQESPHHLIDHFSISLNVGDDKYMVDKNRWKDQWKDQSRLVPYNLDSFAYEQYNRYDRIRNPAFDMGIRVQVVHDLSRRLVANKQKPAFQLATGLGFRFVKEDFNPLLRSNGQFPYTDTSKIYTAETVRFSQSRSILSLNQALMYRFNSFIYGMKFFIGAGFIATTELTNKVDESYRTDTSRYNRTQRRFETKSNTFYQKVINAKKNTQIGLFIPAGFTFKLARRNDFLFEIDYSSTRNKFTNVHKKNEAWRMQLGYSYNFSR